ncbi:hypothetical protein RFI_31805 [Reticulomyxa filosa]|uniref:Uncharacterized protein n=1 Tax=Reticulomyxa filosa TaxID=46433 RepID=X6LW40_RETFI|nr:hypothetical protein RFI_31805 [Reticulomyxa filosa]|eukprot:ETO05591.1 hypothetical protein RFI_31805 [Reticulomyxa filosa]
MQKLEERRSGKKLLPFLEKNFKKKMSEDYLNSWSLFRCCNCLVISFFSTLLGLYVGVYLNSSTLVEDFSVSETSLWKSSDKLETIVMECPVFEDICVYEQQFRARSESQSFRMIRILEGQTDQSSLFGKAKSKDKNTAEVHNIEMYEHLMNAVAFNKSTNEYERAQCMYDPIKEHMMIHVFYPHTITEFLVRALKYMYYFFDVSKVYNASNTRLWMFLPDQKDMYTFHHLLLERFSAHEIYPSWHLFDIVRCKCFQTLHLCGFAQTKDVSSVSHSRTMRQVTQLRPIGDLVQIASRTSKGNVSSWSQPPTSAQLMESYNAWLDDTNVHMDKEALQWKKERLRDIFRRNSQKRNVDNIDINLVKMIGFYQRQNRRKWDNLGDILDRCNDLYNPINIFCSEIQLEDFVHPRDVVLMHRGLDMVVGIHGILCVHFVH